MIDTFSGIGGFSLAARWLGGIETIQFVEREPFCQRILAKHWPKIPIHDDICTFTPPWDQPTLFAADSPAKTSARRERKPAWLVNDRGSFTNCLGSFVWWNPATSSWRTWQQSLLTGWETFWDPWPRQGMTRNGRAYQQQLWEPAINEIAGGALPTPKASDGERGRDKARARPDTKSRELATRLRDLLPTPRANSAMTCELHGQANKPNPNLETVMGQMLLTPTANDWKGRTNWEARGRNGPQRLPDLIPTGAATYLNPSFVEEMMGFPVGWTA
jgi:hypothetical protein